MSCFKCKRTGEKICNAEEAEIRCMVCGFCESQENANGAEKKED